MQSITETRGLTESEYAELKQAVKKLGFASVRIHKGARTYNSVDIRPIKRNNEWALSPEEVDTIIALINSYNLYISFQNHTVQDNRHLIFRSGFHYMRKITKQVVF